LWRGRRRRQRLDTDRLDRGVPAEDRLGQHRPRHRHAQLHRVRHLRRAGPQGLRQHHPGRARRSRLRGRRRPAKLTTVSATITGGGQTVTDTESGSDFYDSNYLPLGTQTADEYTVVNGSATIPQTARVGDTGTAYSDNRYTNSSKTSFLGTNTYTYALQADTASTAIAQIVGIEKDGLGATTYTRTLRYRITPAGAVTPLSETVTDSDGSMVFTYN
jgi:hypothetical protein